MPEQVGTMHHVSWPAAESTASRFLAGDRIRIAVEDLNGVKSCSTICKFDSRVPEGHLLFRRPFASLFWPMEPLKGRGLSKASSYNRAQGGDKGKLRIVTNHS
eukprot:gnl/TRDRNA2_/TRDRNA2_206930_c0_seq1.p1 gnl/TRDRNA2_/TRDRNA2_206930_c0~~gnl/TRDRNA2_/TRDRNA2_206930_c0_seq1.p1  ORF type:complete len:103 (+),score=1.28 gnl/TRDRNA2_/TRDRNA2_206930_c0_seq1:313-621(+)